MAPAYHWHRMFLQHLQSRHPAQRWVLKSPGHQWCLGALLDEYPDALLVQTHRDPLQIIASIGSLVARLRSLASDEASIPDAAAEFAELVIDGLDRSVTAREDGTVPADRIVDVQFAEFMARSVRDDPRGVRAARSRAHRRCRSAHARVPCREPARRFGAHEYTWAETGLDEGEWRERLAAISGVFRRAERDRAVASAHMDRREFLRLGALRRRRGRAGAVQQRQLEVDAARGDAPRRPPRGRVGARRRARPTAASTPSSSLMMENRSFDSYFGWLARDEQYLEQGRSRYGAQFAINGKSFQEFPAPDGKMVKTARRVLSKDAQPWRGCGHPDPGPRLGPGPRRTRRRLPRDRRAATTSSRCRTSKATTFRSTTCSPRRFTVCDRWHASVLGPTYPNREYLLSAQSGGHKDNYLPFDRGRVPVADHRRSARGRERQRRRVLHRLAAAVAVGPAHDAVHPQRSTTFAADAAAGKLPSVSFVTPGVRRRQPHRRPSARRSARRAEVRARRVRRVREIAAVGARAVRAHLRRVGRVLRPRRAADPARRAREQERRRQLRGRPASACPTVLASPYAQPGFVDHTLYDHTSVLRFLEWRFLGAPPRGPGGDTDKWFLTDARPPRQQPRREPRARSTRTPTSASTSP